HGVQSLLHLLGHEDDERHVALQPTRTARGEVSGEIRWRRPRRRSRAVSASLAHLNALRGWLTQNAAAIFREALAIEEPAGSSPSWQQACHYHGVPISSDQEREEIRRLQQPLRG